MDDVDDALELVVRLAQRHFLFQHAVDRRFLLRAKPRRLEHGLGRQPAGAHRLLPQELAPGAFAQFGGREGLARRLQRDAVDGGHGARSAAAGAGAAAAAAHPALRGSYSGMACGIAACGVPAGAACGRTMARLVRTTW